MSPFPNDFPIGPRLNNLLGHNIFTSVLFLINNPPRNKCGFTMRLVLPLISVLPLVLASPIDASGDALSDTTTAIITTPNNDNRNTIMPGWHVGADPATEDCGAELIGYGPIPEYV